MQWGQAIWNLSKKVNENTLDTKVGYSWDFSGIEMSEEQEEEEGEGGKS